MIQSSTKKLIGFCAALLIQYISIAQDSSNFGSKDMVSNGFVGKVYALPKNIQQLPDFDTMRSLGKIYTKEINIPNRSWTEGFPGVTDRFEWFGIEYISSFKVTKAGLYTFQLRSDDGSKLFIDDRLVINNDGLHLVHEKQGEIYLDRSTHTIKIHYYQGPPTEIALQLFASLDKEASEVFPGKNFKLSTPVTGFINGISGRIPLLALLSLLLLFVIFITRSRSNRNRVFHISRIPLTTQR